MSSSLFLHIYRTPGASAQHLINKIGQKFGFASRITSLETEYCYNFELDRPITEKEKIKLLWIVTETFEPQNVREEVSFLTKSNQLNEYFVEVGPRFAFSTAWSSNATSMFTACGITCIKRVERSRRFRVLTESEPLTEIEIKQFHSLIHDRMTEFIYTQPLTSFDNGMQAVPVQMIPILEQGKAALEALNQEKGLGFDDWDLDYYTSLFLEKLQRNPTDVECFDLAQSNSEHSRHWFFSGQMVIDGEVKEETLFQMVKATLPKQSNSIIAFHDNSSAITGFEVNCLRPSNPASASPMRLEQQLLHPILTAETHNFPSGVAPFPGAETGTGGRLRDVQATGRGAHTLAGISSYCVGNLLIPGHTLPWESSTEAYPSNLASPLDILVEASNGASDYGNKYGEPVVAGFTRSFGQRLSGSSGERYEWIKPIMFTAGVGMLDDRHAVKGSPEVGMVVCKVGGPAYRIGMGGGAASSRVQGTVTDADLDFNAVQRGDAEMENRMNRVIRACIELGDKNPIVSIHDQGAGGNGNVLKEIVDPLGARLQLREIPVGDPTLSALEIWGAEYQENNAFLVRPEDLPLIKQLSNRENCPVSAVGVVTGDGLVVVEDSIDGSTPFALPLSLVLGKMPQKTFTFTTPKRSLRSLTLPSPLTLYQALTRVLQLLDVGSKRFLTNKVDRSVTGLVAQQQCCGPLQTPLADVAVLAQSPFGLSGVAIAVGEQPIKGLVDNAAQARMTVAEALSNLVFARITKLEDVKASGNWMWAAKLEGEGAKMYQACLALKETLLQLGPAIDGGKDSLSMAAKVNGEVVKAPGELTLTVYAAVKDITKTITPDFKGPGLFGRASKIVWVDVSRGKQRLGGSALATCYNQVGDTVPDLDSVEDFQQVFNIIQELLDRRVLLAGHDRSDGGLITTVLEMAFAGNCGVKLDLSHISSLSVASNCTAIDFWFNEEVGFVLEVLPEHLSQIYEVFAAANCSVPVYVIGETICEDRVEVVASNKEILLLHRMTELRDLWEATSFALEKLQCNVDCVEQEQQSLSRRFQTGGPHYITTFTLPRINILEIARLPSSNKPRVAVIRQEGSNGDRELLASFYSVGFEVWDVNMRDLLAADSQIRLDRFRGIAFCGGFSYADVNDSAKGWAGVIRFNPTLLAQFAHFQERNDTFSVGICNGCQLMALLGWIPFPTGHLPDSSSSTARKIVDSEQLRFIHNDSGRFESRWSTVKILESPAVLLRDMAGSSLGIWVAHGEGKAYFPNPSHLELIEQYQLAPIRYVDDHHQITERYPMNPNGSPRGIAAVCSVDGRHLAMMPHPERCTLQWQLPYRDGDLLPSQKKQQKEEEGDLLVAPWMKLFENAWRFCQEEK